MASILEDYQVIQLENDPYRYDVKINIGKFLADKEHQGLSPYTLKSYRAHLSFFEQHMPKKLQEITKDDIKGYLNTRETITGGVQKVTMETIRSVLKCFFGWLDEEEIITGNPMLRIKPYKVPKTLAKALTVEELEQLRESCETPREKAIIEILYSTGCRLSEVVRINLEDVDWQNRTVKITGKGNKERITFFSVRAAIYVKKYLGTRDDDTEALLVSERRPHFRLSARSVESEVGIIGKRSGINKSIYPHVMRHTMATLMLNKGCPMSVVQELLGHEDIAATQTYAKVTSEYKHQSYEKYFHQ